MVNKFDVRCNNEIDLETALKAMQLIDNNQCEVMM